MKIEHIAIWVRDLEKMKEFYETYFAGTSTELYHNKKRGFTRILSTLIRVVV